MGEVTMVPSVTTIARSSETLHKQWLGAMCISSLSREGRDPYRWLGKRANPLQRIPDLVLFLPKASAEYVFSSASVNVGLTP